MATYNFNKNNKNDQLDINKFIKKSIDFNNLPSIIIINLQEAINTDFQ